MAEAEKRTNREGTTLNERPDRVLVKKLLSRYVPVRLNASIDHLASNDRRALRKLIDSAAWVDRIYWRQRSQEGWLLKQSVSQMEGEDARELERLLNINFGPWDSIDGDRSFWGDSQRPPGGNSYPADLTREEIEHYLQRRPEERRDILSHTTLVRREEDRLVAVPYHDAYQAELTQISKGLLEASGLVTDERFGAFLRSRAEDLLTDSLRNSEAIWIQASDSPIDIAIGPYEVYDDALMGLKASYEATVVVRHALSERLHRFESLAPELRRLVPGAVTPMADRRHFAIGVYDVVYAAGMANMGSKAVAATLPSDEEVRADLGVRILLFQNVILEKFKQIVQPLAERIIEEDQIELVREDAFLNHTLLHELAHALGGFFIDGAHAATRVTANEALRERYSMIEECRADLIGIVYLNLLVRKGLLPGAMSAAAAVTFVLNNVRTLRFGAKDDYGRVAVIILSYLARRGALTSRRGGRLSVDVDGVHRGALELARRVQSIVDKGNYKAAGLLMDEFGSLPAEVETLLSRLADVPVDIEFMFQDSGSFSP